jgi:hypothetical protein
MAHLVDACISEAVEAATGIDFEQEEMVEERLRLSARMKGGGIQKQIDTKRPMFLDALLDILPRCIEITEANQWGSAEGLLYKTATSENGGRSLQL